MSRHAKAEPLILSFFSKYPHRLVSVQEVSTELGLSYHSSRKVFSKLRKQNIIVNVDKGIWQAAKKKGRNVMWKIPIIGSMSE